MISSGILYIFGSGCGKLKHICVEFTIGEKIAFRGGPGLALIFCALILIQVMALTPLEAAQQGEEQLPEVNTVEDIIDELGSA